jgi:hypothetical protein
MSLESGLDTLKYLKKWLTSDDNINHVFNTNIPYHDNFSKDLIGWKAAYIKNWKLGEFSGLSHGEYKITDSYRCIRRVCVFGSCNKCGFYSYNDEKFAKKTCSNRFGTVILKVAHYGTVFVHEKGYRSEEQEVLSVSISSRCSRFLCKNNSSGLRKIGSYYGSACNKHKDSNSDFNTLSNLWGVEVRVIN